MAMDSASTEAVDIEGGVALSFTTSKGDVDDLRRRVRETAEMYRSRPHRGGWRWRRMSQDGAPGPGGRRGPRGMRPGLGPMPAANISVDEVDNGARILFHPVDAQQLEALREHVRAHHDRMSSRECPMRSPAEEPNNAAGAQEP